MTKKSQCIYLKDYFSSEIKNTGFNNKKIYIFKLNVVLLQINKF